MLKILTVWYNEEENLEKLYSSLEKLKKQDNCEFFYVDQENSIFNASNDSNFVRYQEIYSVAILSHGNFNSDSLLKLNQELNASHLNNLLSKFLLSVKPI